MIIPSTLQFVMCLSFFAVAKQWLIGAHVIFSIVLAGQSCEITLLLHILSEYA